MFFYFIHHGFFFSKFFLLRLGFILNFIYFPFPLFPPKKSYCYKPPIVSRTLFSSFPPLLLFLRESVPPIYCFYPRLVNYTVLFCERTLNTDKTLLRFYPHICFWRTRRPYIRPHTDFCFPFQRPSELASSPFPFNRGNY